MFQKIIDLAGGKVTLEYGELAQRADGSVLAKFGSTHILCTVSCSAKVDPNATFFPLSVHFQDRFYAVGRVPGGFLKREGRPSEREIILSRLIDRSIRPLFPEGFLHEVQVVCVLLSYDEQYAVEMPALLGVSAALRLAGLPILQTVAGVRVTLDNGKVVPLAGLAGEGCALDLFVSGTKDGVLMVESAATELSEQCVLDALLQAHAWVAEAVQEIDSIDVDASPEWCDYSGDIADFKDKILDKYAQDIKASYDCSEKKKRTQMMSAVREKAEALFGEDVAPAVRELSMSAAESKVVRGNMVATGKRLDGRQMNQVREVTSKVRMLPCAHGSALFNRGETQVLATVTLCNASDAQIVDTVEGVTKQRFMLHYTFPPYSVGEAGRIGAVGRREIGHGNLAWKALAPVIPSEEECPYAIRCASEVLSSNGSSSMATVCGVSLALMDAGVKTKAPVAGIAMGLVKEGDDISVLTDILGDEDHLGDMDFKVAGTAEGITALQMDLKIPFVSKEILEKALDDAKQARLLILEKMSSTLAEASEDTHESVPSIQTIQVDKKFIGRIIGAGGKTIKSLSEEHEVQINISDSGEVQISGPRKSAVDGAVASIEKMVYQPSVGDTGRGVVRRIKGGKVLIELRGQYGILAEGEDTKVEEGQELDVVISRVDAGGEKLFFKINA